MITPHRRARRTPTVLVATTALLLPVMAASAWQASAQPEGGQAVAPESGFPPPGPTTSTTHDLAPAANVAGARSMTLGDAAEAREHAGGRSVTVVSATDPVDLPELAVVGVTWRAGSAPGGTVQYRTNDAGAWSDWEFLELEGDHAPDDEEAKEAAAKVGGARIGSAPLVTTDSDELQVRVLAAEGSTPDDAQLTVIDPGTTTDPTSSSTAGTTGSTDLESTVAKPQIYTRAQWGADESIRDPSEPSYGAVDLAVVHHTAGSNNYTEPDVPGIIRGIYTYHVKTNGWRDIGYNFLVDKFGRIWEGRYGGMDRAVVGAHAYGVNSFSMGASVLGNFEEARPPAAVSTALRNLIAWKADVHRFDVLGTTVVTIDDVTKTLNNISGHRNVNSTACPGSNLYATLPTLRTATAALSPAATRYAGDNRYETAAAASAATFGPGVPVAYVGTGATFPDALAGGPAGGHRGGPVLLTAKDSLPPATKAELVRLKPAEIVVLGGTTAVSSTVAGQLATLAPKTSRIAGTNRYETAAELSERTFGTGVPVAYVATGSTFPDALAGGPAGGFRGGPLLLTGTSTLPTATINELKRLAPASIVVLGGPTAVSDAVVSKLRSYSSSVARVAGADRYETAVETSKRTFSRGVPVVFVATGANFPDALAGGPLGGHLGGPVLLTRKDSLPSVTANELLRLAPSRVIVLGGTGAVSTAVAKRLYNYEEPSTS